MRTYNETVELVIPLSAEEHESCALWLHSLMVTCQSNSISVTLVDRDNSLAKVENPIARYLHEAPRVQIINGQNLTFPACLQAGAEHAKRFRPESMFVCFSHPDVVGVGEGWLDRGLETLLDLRVGAVGFEPGATLNVHHGSIVYVDDWLLLTKRDVLERVGVFPSTLTSFGWAVWFHAKLTQLGYEERILTSTDGCQLVSHRRRTGRIVGGRKQNSTLYPIEAAALQAELVKLWKDES